MGQQQKKQQKRQTNGKEEEEEEVEIIWRNPSGGPSRIDRHFQSLHPSDPSSVLTEGKANGSVQLTRLLHSITISN